VSGAASDVDTDEVLEHIRAWVEIETPTTNAAAVNQLVDLVEAEVSVLGMKVERTPGRSGYGDMLVARSPWGGTGPGILVLAHLDTVHPIGTLLQHNPWRRDGDRVFGPGTFDMKSGTCIALHAYRLMTRSGGQTALPITFLFVPDEEIGSPTSRAIIEDAAKANAVVLVPEPAHGGRCCTARKGVAHFDIQVTGRPAHGGSRHQDGRSAILELARHVVELEAMTDYAAGTTVNVGLISGGSFINVVPAAATAKVCVRARETETLEALIDDILARKPFDPDVRLDIGGAINRPVFERSRGTARLYEHTRAICRRIGFDLVERHSGGGSDGNFTAALGVPTLDGLGADGHGHHTLDEYILASSLAPRVAMWMELFSSLTQSAGEPSCSAS
jgi:glutamate carboxypeptidase